MTSDDILREAVQRTIAAKTATVWFRFAKAGEQALEAMGHVDFGRRRSHLRYEMPGEADGEDPVQCEQVLAGSGTYLRAGAPGAPWQVAPSAGGGGALGDPLGFLDALATARPGVQALDAQTVGGIAARRYRMIGDGERIWAAGSPEVTVRLRERLGLSEPEDPVIDVWIDEDVRVRRIEGREETPLSPGPPIVSTVEFGDFGIELGEIPIPTADERIDLDDLLPERDEPSGGV
jgi:hypothetical protein